MSASDLRILTVASEYEGLVKTGGLADVARALPAALAARGADVRVVLPWYRSLQAERMAICLPTLEVRINRHQVYGCRVRQWQDGGVTLYLIEHQDFFDRPGLYDDGTWPYADNPLRFAFLSQAALALAETLDFRPDILHAHDWQTALAPYYLQVHRQQDPFFRTTRSVLTVHNGAYQGRADNSWAEPIGLDARHITPDQFEDHGDINLLKGGLAWAHALVPVSTGYAAELLAPDTSHGLWQAFRRAKDRLQGILNGCDYSRWNPETDAELPARYSASDLSGKAACKTALQTESGLPLDHQMPLFGIVSRLTGQKGFSLLLPELPDWLTTSGAQLVILGSGDPDIAQDLHRLQAQFPAQVQFTPGYNDGLAHRIEAGCDYFLMPSLFEPCGLNQIYSMRYGTLPVVHLTGGLKDTVIPADPPGQPVVDRATGLGFKPARPEALRQALDHAIWLYQESPDQYRAIQQTAMAQRFTWEQAAQAYLALYRRLVSV